MGQLVVWCSAALAFAIVALQSSAAEVSDPGVVAAMEKFLSRPTTTHHYNAWRRLEASGHGQHAWLDAQTRFTVASGFLYEVTDEGGSRYIRSRVLHSLLAEEQRLIARGASATVAVSTDNYEFKPEAFNHEGLAVVALAPLRRDRSLIAGRMFLTAADGDLVRIEGHLARNPSFWTTRVNVVRRYQRINGVLMPVSLDSTAQLRFLGSSWLRMTYVYSDIDERPVVMQ